MLEPVHYFARRTLLQDSPDGRAGDNVCLRTRIQMLLEKLRPGGENNPDTILSVCAMNQAAKSPAGRWHSKSIFVHSKVVMADDKLLVVGSANLNDRSFVGDRDSELGVLLCATNPGRLTCLPSLTRVRSVAVGCAGRTTPTWSIPR